MSRDDLHFRLRIPEALKVQVEKAAAENKRSMTAEIIARLERSFGIEPEWEEAIANVHQLWAKVEALEKMVLNHDENLNPSKYEQDL